MKQYLPHLAFTLIFVLFFVNDSYTQGSETVYQLKDTTYAEELLLAADSLAANNDAEKAIELAEQARDIYIQILGPENNQVANSYELIGKAYYYLSEHENSIKHLTTALNMYLAVNPNGIIKIGEMYNDLGVVSTNAGAFKEALKYHTLSINYKEKYYPDSLANIAASYSSKGTTYQYLNVVDSAIILHEQALQIRLKVFGAKSEEVANSFYSLGSCMDQLGKRQQQLEYILKSKEVLESLDDDFHTDLLRCYNLLGNVYKSFEDYEKMIFYHELVLERQLLKEGPKSIGVAIAYNNLGNDYIRMTKYRLAKALIEKAISALPDHLPDDYIHYGSFYNNLGQCYNSLGDHQRAIEFYEKDLNIRIKNYGEKNSRLLYPLHNLGSVCVANEEYEKAISYFQKAYEAHSTSFDEIHPYTPFFYESMADAYLRLKDFENAEKYYNKTAKINLALDNKKEGYGAYYNMGKVYYYKGNYLLATKSFMDAAELTLKKNGPVHPSLAYTYHFLGMSLHKEGNYTDADSIFQKALIAFNYSTPYSFEEVNQIKYLSGLLQTIGYYYQEKFIRFNNPEDLEISKDFLNQAKKSIDFKKSYISPDSKNKETKVVKQLNDLQITNLTLSKKAGINHPSLDEQIFGLAEKSKANILLNAVQESNALAFSGIPDSIIKKEYDLRLEITSLEKQMQSRKEIKDTLYLNTSNAVADLKTEYNVFKNKLEDEYPDYYQAKYDLSTISLEKVRRNILTTNKTLLEYVIGDSASYVLIVNTDTFHIHEIIKKDSLERLVADFSNGLTQYHSSKGVPRSLLAKLTKEYIRSAYQLHQALIAPVADLLHEELIIIPDGVLGYIPFEVLLSAKPRKITAFHNYPYLIKTYRISYCYSATLLEQMLQKKNTANTGLKTLALAPFFHEDLNGLQAVIDTMELFSLRSDTLQSLIHSGAEAAKVAKVTSGDLWVGTKANKKRFIEQAPYYNIIHLSTHGVADDKVGDYAFLALGTPESKSAYDKLYIREIYDLALNADMVVLSACKTSFGKLQQGEGIISMARAFAYAGAKSIITTHWSVDDQSTEELMESFYKQLAFKKSKHAALREAKLEFLKDHKNLKAHPFFWAAFIGIGDMSPIQN